MKKAFTLAEILITLAIIGVIAAMSLPSLIANTQNKGYVTGIQKAFAVGNAAIQKVALDNCGTTNLNCFSSNISTFGNAIAAQYNVAKNCGITIGGNCFAKTNCFPDGTSTSTWDLDNNIDHTGSNTYYKFITTDGMTLAIYFIGHCNVNSGLTSNSPTYKTCGAMIIDVNGITGPNYLGRDVFKFYITSNVAPLLYPMGGREDNWAQSGSVADGGDGYWNYQGTKNGCSKTVSKWGERCAGRLLENNWQMDY